MNSVERVKELCKEKKIAISRLEKELGFANGYIGQLRKGVLPDDRLNAIATYFGVQTDWLTGASEYRTMAEALKHFDDITDIPALRESIKEARIGIREIPVLGEVAAGIPIFANENYIDYEVISEEMAKDGEYFGLKVKGDSMAPRIMDGDTLIVRKQNDAETGDIVVALINGDSATCKKLTKREDGISLFSFNPAYDPMDFTNKDIMEKPVVIIGKVIENRQRY